MQFYTNTSYNLQLILFAGVWTAFLYLLVRHRRNAFSELLIFMFFPVSFMMWGTTAGNIYKIIVLVYTLILLYWRKAWQLNDKQSRWLTTAFTLFTIAYFVSVFNNSGNTITIIFSQYARYVEFYCLFFLLRDAVYQRNKSNELLRLFYEIFLAQILISIFKWFLFQRQIEGLVGSMSIVGGALGTALPILGLIVLYVYRNGKLSWKDWLFVAGLMLIGFTTGKRAVWFIMPAVIAAFFIYVRGIQLNKYIIIVLLAIPIVFYFGVRLTPSLNPEHQIWGSFDWDYALGYAEHYQFGEEGLTGYHDGAESQLSSQGGVYNLGNKAIEAEGRGGATIALVRLLFDLDYTMTDQDLYGIGFSNMYSIDYETFDKLALTIHLDHKGSATGLFQSYVTTGYFGVFTTILLMFFPFFFIRYKRMRWTILLILAWEYFFYTGIIFRTPAMMAVLLFVLHYSNLQYAQARQRKMDKQIKSNAI